MASYNPDKMPPPLSESANYEDWKKMVNIWSNFTSLAKEKQGTAVLLSLKGADQEAVLELDQTEISHADGLTNVLNRLDNLYLKDTTLQKYKALENFESYRRTPSTPISDFIHEFEKRHHKIKNHGTTISDDLLAFRLLKSANLPAADEKLAKGTSELTYASMKDQLKKLFSDSSSLSSSPAETTGRFEDIHHHESYEGASTLYTVRGGNRRNYRGPFNNRYNRGSTNTNWRSQSTPNNSTSKSTPPRNPRDQYGNFTKCNICESIIHYAPTCPHQYQRNQSAVSTFFTPSSDTETNFQGVPPVQFPEEEFEIVLHQSDYDMPHHMDTLISESTGCAVLDCGASRTVTGDAWWKMLYDSFSVSQQQECKFSTSSRHFKFGDGEKYNSMVCVNFPAKIGNKNIRIEADIVKADIPLLFSMDSMKKAGMSIDFKTDMLTFQGQQLPLTITKSGHLVIPITQGTRALQESDHKIVNVTLSAQSGNMNKKEIALKLHRQFAHASTERIVNLLKMAGDPWNNDPDLYAELKTISNSCDTCARYRKPPPRPVVGLPLATNFLECVSFDLKFLQSKIIIHFIDQATRLSAAARIPNKNPETIVGAIMKHWIGIFGAATTFHTDNGGEFVNESLIQLSQQFGITLNTTAAYSPWSNGTIERHNLVLGEMIEKVLADTKCHFDVALAWSVNAKNSLANVHGFSPYQLVMGQNPPLPSTLTAQPPSFTSVTEASRILVDNLKALHAARKAFVEAESSARIRRALNSNVRSYSDSTYLPGDKVYYHRQGSHEWRGPATILGKDGQVVLLKHGGYYIRVHPCRLTHVPSPKTPETSSSQNTIPPPPPPESSIHALRKSIPVFEEEEEENNPAPTPVVEVTDEQLHSALNQIPVNVVVDEPEVAFNETLEELHLAAQQLTTGETQVLEATRGMAETPVTDTQLNDIQMTPITPTIAETSVKDKETPSFVLNTPTKPAKGRTPSNALLMNLPTTPTPVSRKPSPGDLIKVTYKDATTAIVKIHSRAGKSTGAFSHSWNITNAAGAIQNLDLRKDVVSWEFIAADVSNADHEFVSTQFYQAQVSDEIATAMQKELSEWKRLEVYKEVDNVGQDSISVRWVITTKEVDGIITTKARLCARGFQEQQDFRTDSPTCSRESTRLTFIVVAAHQWDLHSIDIKTAFLQGKEIERTVFIKPPPEAKTEKLWQLRKCVYGLADAPREFYNRLRAELESLQATTSSLDQGLFTWDTLNSCGIASCHVDDILYGGDPLFHDSVMVPLNSTFSIGTRNTNCFTYIGMNIAQLSDKCIQVDQHSYAETIHLLQFDKRRPDTSPLTLSETAEFRSIIGQLNWLAGITRPDLSFEVCQLSSVVREAKISDAKLLNKAVRKIRNEKVILVYPQLKLDTLKIQCYSDASFANLPNEGSQGGNIIFLTDGTRSAPLQWSSNRMKRVVRSTLGAETLSLISCCDSAVYLQALVKSVLYQPPKLIPIECIVDNKSLHENIHSTKPPLEQRLRIDIASLREMVGQKQITVTWKEKCYQLADCLTKRGASSQLLIDCLESGTLPPLC